jgi:ferredoxin
MRVDMDLSRSPSERGREVSETFQLGGDGVLCWKDEVDPSLSRKAREGVGICPMQAIGVED